MLAGGTGDAALRQDVRAALAAEGQDADDALVGRIAAEVGRLSRAAGQVQMAMIESGRRLLRLQELAGQGGCRALHRAGLIPMSETTASKLRIIATAVDAGRIPADRLPRAVEAAAIVARLPDERVARLIEDGTLRPEAKQRELREATREPEPVPSRRGPPTPAERRELERRAARLEAELARIRKRLSER